MNLGQTRFDEATPDQFCEFWEGQGWKVVDCSDIERVAERVFSAGFRVNIYSLLSHAGDLSIGKKNRWLRLSESIATFDEALRLANNLAQAELFGGWAE